MTISEQIETARRERRVLARVCRAAWRLEQAGRERAWVLAQLRAEGVPIRRPSGREPGEGRGEDGRGGRIRADDEMAR